MGKAKQYRNKQERMEHCASLKRGQNIELLRPVSDCNPADLGIAEEYEKVRPDQIEHLTVGDLCERLGIKELYYRAADANEAMRDMQDVEAVMNEKNLVGTCFAYRRVGEKTRAMQTVAGFVEPKQVIGESGEEAAVTKEVAETEEPPAID